MRCYGHLILKMRATEISASVRDYELERITLNPFIVILVLKGVQSQLKVMNAIAKYQ